MTTSLPAAVGRLIDEFSRLPGIGPKTASRLAFYLLRMPPAQARALSEALRGITEGIVHCARCHNLAESSPCPVCADPGRDAGLVCVVEEPLDVQALERTHEYRGLYHVLHGAISPVDRIGPADLRIGELVSRVRVEPIRELILATNPSLEGDATAMYVERAVRAVNTDLRITRLARGLPMGGDIEYADEQTLARAMKGRSERG
ncbi:MAG: recombination mediator RecR [Anaerolineae bacterium]|nr:recombination protein RecR [Ardenticatenia bacterium]MBK8538896.1 recombination protein RecR [Ardenticatenia bacterium]HQZ70412.1 recombination mediator RecR [Anaerolineae bacterium]HRA20969.1 recombination mediator RecR [Anaerolineae bacterium]